MYNIYMYIYNIQMINDTITTTIIIEYNYIYVYTYYN